MDSYSNFRLTKELHEVKHYITVHRYTQAKDLITKLLSENPVDSELLYLRAYCHLCLKQYNEALSVCMDAIDAGFSLQDGNELLGSIYKKLGDYVKAEQCFLEVLRLNPQNSNVLAQYSSVMLATCHEVKAKKLLDEALSIDPENHMALQVSFRYFLGKNKKAEQIEALLKSFEVAGTEVRKYLDLGLLEYVRGNYKEAREHFLQAFLLEPTSEDYLKLLESVTRESHIIFLPERIIDKVGGQGVLFAGFLVIEMTQKYFGLYNIFTPLAMFYATLCIYTWFLAPLIGKVLIKRG